MIELITPKILERVYHTRDIWSHKGQFGKLLVVSGSKRHTGSPIFSAMAAYRAGCDLVYLAAPERAANVAANYSPNIITETLEGDKLESRHITKIKKLIEDARITAMLIGPGLWRDGDTFEAIQRSIKEIDLPLVIDADAIRAISDKKEILGGKNVILTPHANEFFAFSGIEIGKDLDERIRAVVQTAKELKSKYNCNATILLKGHVDIIANSEKLAFNKTGNPLMTKGGFGDTLAGICGAYLARNVSTFDAACAAAFVNGKAGELASKELGESVLATDLLNFISKAIR